MAFRRDGNRLHVELWTTPVGDQIRTYVDGAESFSRILREDQDSFHAVLAEMRADALERGWVEETLPSP